MGPKAFAKASMTRVGGVIPERGIRATERMLDYIALGRFLRLHGMDVGRPVPDREALFGVAASQVGQSRVLYLEFGVWEGRSMRWWSEHLNHPEAELHGFDSFEGLPESWNDQDQKGAYNARGKVPDISDPRVRFHVGWFSDTLPRFQLPNHERLIVNFDADLYSSTVTALESVAEAVRPGTIFYFDELADREHELRAFDEYLVTSGRSFKVTGAANTYTQWMFECVS